jgi:cytochrome c oxidase cbb3-type subunit 3
MKHLRIFLTMAFAFLITPVFAEDDHSLMTPQMQNYIGYGAIVFALLLFIVVMLVLLRTFKVLTRIIMKGEGYSDAEILAELKPQKKGKKQKGEVWNKILSLKPLSQEKELVMAHEYDGIQELDNPIPGWFMYLFYITIVFAIGYLLIYHVFGIGQLQYAEYKTEMAEADVAKKEFLSKQANRVDENSVKLLSDPATISAGQAIFKTTCAACHGEHGQGVVGPNLTDDFWLHGGKINDVFKTIKYGVPAKGMPTWEKQLSAKQISDVANYVESLHDTNPAGAKEPQGTKESVTDAPVKKALVTANIK